MIGQAAMDQIHTLVQPKARALGAAINTEDPYLANFARWARPSLQTNKNTVSSKMNTTQLDHPSNNKASAW